MVRTAGSRNIRTIRIGNDIDIIWALYYSSGINEVPYNLNGRDIKIYLRCNNSSKIVIDNYSVDGHIISWRFKGKHQVNLGVYTMTIVENDGKDDMHTVDECRIFKLVAESCQASGGCNCGDNDNIQVISLEFKSKMSVGYPIDGGGGGTTNITIDNVLSETSENPVQNKVVTAAIKELEKDAEELADKMESIEAGGIKWTDVQ